MNIAKMVIPRQKLIHALILPTACNILDNCTHGRTLTTFGARTFYTSTVLSKNYYDVLGLTPRASEAQIKSAYYTLSKQFHPDVNKSADAKHKFAEISEAYETLGNRARRRIYDGMPQRSRVGLQSTARGRSFDAEYDNFRKSAGQFKQRPSAPMTGKTAHFDFDEFYRQHYGEALRETRNLRQKRKQFEHYDRMNKWERVPMGLIYAILGGFAISVMYTIVASNE